MSTAAPQLDPLAVLRDKFKIDESPLLWRVRCTTCKTSWILQRKLGNTIADDNLLQLLSHFTKHQEEP